MPKNERHLLTYSTLKEREEGALKILFDNKLDYLRSAYDMYFIRNLIQPYSQAHPLKLVDKLNQAYLPHNDDSKDLLDITVPFSKWDLTEFWVQNNHLLTSNAIRYLGGIASQIKMSEQVAFELAERYLETVKYSNYFLTSSILFHRFSAEVRDTEQFKIFRNKVSSLNDPFIRIVHCEEQISFTAGSVEYDEAIAFLISSKRKDPNTENWLLSLLTVDGFTTLYEKEEDLDMNCLGFYFLKTKYNSHISPKAQTALTRCFARSKTNNGYAYDIESGDFFKYVWVAPYELALEEWDKFLTDYPQYGSEVILNFMDAEFLYHPGTVAALNDDPFFKESKYLTIDENFTLLYNLYLVWANDWEILPLKYKRTLKRLMLRELKKEYDTEVLSDIPMDWLIAIVKTTILTVGAVKVS